MHTRDSAVANLCFSIFLLYVVDPSLSFGQQQCTNRFMDLSLISFRAVQEALRVDLHLTEELRILGEYQFNCTTTNITHLILGIDVRLADENRILLPSVQLFRPSISGGDDYYVLVPGSQRTVYYSPSNVSTNGEFEYQLDPPISVNSGDLLAVSQPRQQDSSVRIHYTSNAGPSNNYQFDFGTTTVSLESDDIISNQLILIYPVTDGYCVSSSFNSTVIRNNALLAQDREAMRERRQFLYPDIMFSCNGSITKWIYGGLVDADSSTIQVELQIWRSMGTNNYNKVGASSVNANTVNGTNVYEYIPQPPLVFQEGDIFGIHLPRESRRKLDLLEQRRNGPTNLRIDRDVDDAPSSITVTLRTEGGNDFPLVTVEISTSTTLMPLTSSLPSGFTTLETIITKTLSVTQFTSSETPATSSERNIIFTSSNLNSSNFGLTITKTLSVTQFISGETPATSSEGSIIFTSNSHPNPSNLGLVISVVLVALLLIIILIGLIIFITVIVMAKKAKNQKTKTNESVYDQPSTIKQSGALSNPLYSNSSSQMLPGAISSHSPIIEHDTEHRFYAEAGMPAPNYENPLNRDYMKPVQPLPCNELEWGIVVPTMSQRSNVENKGIYFELQNTIYSSLTKTEAEYKLVSIGSDGSFFFTENDVYWSPGSDCSSIYEQLSNNKFREVIRGQIKIITRLGSGQFGTVHQGVWNSPSGPLDVAVKTLNDKTSEVEKIKFLQEAAIMGQFHHPNIIKLHGVVTLGEPVMIVIEMMNKGDLKQYLETFRPSPGELVSSTVVGLLLSFCRQVASGMEYLSKKCFVHRDLAARNILVAEQGICKISDFGLSRDLQDENYYVSKGGQIPIKWTAPEAIHYKKYSSASDVWSFGVVMYEIWSLGHKPFHEMSNQESFRQVESGYRLPPPPGCTRAVYQIMIQCWHPESTHRLSFADLVTHLSKPDWSLMLWSKSDKTVHPQATVLGAPLDAGKNLFTDLQFIYKN